MISEVEATQFSLIISNSTAAVCSLTNPGVTYESIFYDDFWVDSDSVLVDYFLSQ
jgi:hypothetical protein